MFKCDQESLLCCKSFVHALVAAADSLLSKYSLIQLILALGIVKSCALFWQTKIEFVRNLVPEIATTQRD